MISAPAAGVPNPAIHTGHPGSERGLSEELMGLAAASPLVLLVPIARVSLWIPHTQALKEKPSRLGTDH